MVTIKEKINTVSILASLLIVLGAIVMLGWFLKITFLVQLLPNHSPVQFNTALSFFLSGFIILYYYNKKFYLCNFLASIVMIIGVVTLAEYVTRNELGIDEFFVEAFITTKTSNPGRMGPNTAICLTSFSLFIYLSQFKTNKLWPLVVILPCVYGVLGFLSFLGYVFDVEKAYSWGTNTEMAIRAAVGFIILSILSFILLKEKHDISQKQNLKLYNILVFLICAVFFITLWQGISNNYTKKIKAATDRHASIITTRLSAEIQNNVEALERLFSRFDTNSYSSKEAFYRDINYYFNQIMALESLHFHMSNNTDIVMKNPNIKHETIPRAQLSCDESLHKKSSIEKDAITTSSNMGTLCVKNRNSDAVLNLKTMINNYFQGIESNFIISITNKGKLIFQSGDKNDTYNPSFAVKKDFEMNHNGWEITVYPKNKYVKETIGHMPLLVLILGVCISFLILYLLKFRGKLIYNEKALLAAESLKNTILNSTFEGVIGINNKKNIYFINSAAEKLLQIPSNINKEFSLEDIVNVQSHDEAKLIDNINNALKYGEKSYIDNTLLTNHAGNLIPIRYYCSPIMENEKISGVIIVFSDNKERLEQEEKLRRIAYYDTLTNIPNRFSIIRHLAESIARAKRYHYNFSLCFIDIDSFKFINDNHGHHVGDKALKYVGEKIAEITRENDFWGRLCGDEFCLILDGICTDTDIKIITEKIHEAVKKPLITDGKFIHVRLSIGIIPYTSENTPEELLMKADEAMYRAKKQ